MHGLPGPGMTTCRPGPGSDGESSGLPACSLHPPPHTRIPVNLSILIPQAFQKCSLTDVNSNSHAEPSRVDGHIKDTRPGATVPPKEKKVTWQLPAGHRGPSFFPGSDTNTAPVLELLCLLSSPHLFFFLTNGDRAWGFTRDLWLGFPEQTLCSCTRHTMLYAEFRHYVPQPMIDTFQDFLGQFWGGGEWEHFF